MEHYPIFSAGSVVKDSSILSVGELKQNLLKIREKEIAVFQSLTNEDLHHDLFPTQFPHPVVKSKFEAICWEIVHTMWHCGQIALIKRVVDKGFDFK